MQALQQDGPSSTSCSLSEPHRHAQLHPDGGTFRELHTTAHVIPLVLRSCEETTAVPRYSTLLHSGVWPE